MKTTSSALLAACLVVSASSYRCPSPLSIQEPSLASSFSLPQFTGSSPYYELALHDYTQPSITLRASQS